MISVIIVPETKDFEFNVSHENIIWINKNLGCPKLENRNTNYCIPFWIKEGYANRIFHIIDFQFDSNDRYIKLGNSFLLPKKWTNIGQNRRFEYHNLKEFELTEIIPGILMPINQ